MTSVWTRLRKWIAHASLRQRWCGLTTGHSYAGVHRTPSHLVFGTPGSRNVHREVWLQWRCQRCSFAMMASMPEEVLVVGDTITFGPSIGGVKEATSHHVINTKQVEEGCNAKSKTL